jgi:Lsr2
MHVLGSSVLSWSRRAVTVAVKQGSHLLAYIAAVSRCGRPAEQRRGEAAGVDVSNAGPQQPSGTPPVAGPHRTAATPASQRQRPVAARRAATAPVTPAMVRSWAHAQGIQVADRGRIPRSVMEQYRAEVVGTAAVSRRSGGGTSTGPHPPSGRSSAA